MPLTCFIRYEIDPYKKEAFEQYARNWGQIIPRCGADLIGYFKPYRGSNTVAYGVYSVENLGAYEVYCEKLLADPDGCANYDFSTREKFIRREDRMFLKIASTPHGKG